MPQIERPPDHFIWVAAAAIIRGRECLVTRRGPGMRLAGQWEFPGGKVEPGESAADAVVREIREELGLEVAVGPWLGRGIAAVGDGRSVRLEVFEARWTAGDLVLQEHDEARWCDGAALAQLDWAQADVPVVPKVIARLAAERVI